MDSPASCVPVSSPPRRTVERLPTNRSMARSIIATEAYRSVGARD